MLIYALLIGVFNMLGGRWESVDSNSPFDGRLVFRCLLPALVAGVFAFENGHGWWSVYVTFAVANGSLLWFPWGWSFDEITGRDSPMKYPRWLRWWGVTLFPLDNLPSTNRKRGIFMKGVRGMFDSLTYVLLSVVNPWAWLMIPLCFAQGIIYWACGRIFGEEKAVLIAEAVYGTWRGGLIATGIGGHG